MATSGRKRGRETNQSSREACAQPLRPILVEREVALDDFRDIAWEGRSIHSIITNRGWAPICQQRGIAYPEMVGEFYRAMGQIEVDAECFTFVVRGVRITFSPRVIADFLGIQRVIGAYPASTMAATPVASTAQSLPTPNVGTNSLDDSEDEDPVDDGLTNDEVRQLLLDPSTPLYDSSKVIRQADCTAFFRMLNLIVSTNIDPRKHKTDFGIERARLMLRIARGKPIDLPLYFFIRIRSESRYSSVGSLPFALMISNLLLRLGVTVQGAERRMPQIGPLNKITFSKSQSHLLKIQAVQDSGMSSDPACRTSASVERQPARANLDQVRFLFNELKQHMKNEFFEPIMEKLKEMDGRISSLQEDFDLISK
ncbi:uncharacterized protein LOC122297700 [Carya illinoinensis]|uniref:uncharacterized protein LOC122297700 n=1 Tax=Carya illinoinensis TaxID=32201 RepID=UPI001C718D5B|nr:uncharacterized protein LOC122297700 [Carya illinoinensis]